LQVITRACKQVVVAGVVVMQMAHDHVRDRIGLDPDGFESDADRIEDAALTLLRHGLVEPGIDHECAVRAADRPHVEVQRLRHIVRVAADEILARAPLMMAVADRVDLVDIVAHGLLPVSLACSAHLARDTGRQGLPPPLWGRDGRVGARKSTPLPARALRAQADLSHKGGGARSPLLICVCYFAGSANTSRAQRNAMTAAGTPA